MCRPLEKAMSAIAENMPVTFGEKREIELGDGATVTVHSIVVNSREIARITKHDGFWSAAIPGGMLCEAHANGETPDKAMRMALTSGIVRLRAAVENVMATTEAKGDELLALVEGLA